MATRTSTAKRKTTEQLTLPGLPGSKPAFDPTKPVETRDGRKARILCTDAKQDGLGPILALVSSQDDGFESPMFFFADGKFDASRSECGVDLVNAPSRAEIPSAIRFVDTRGAARKFYVSVSLVDEVPVAVKILKEARA